MSSFSEFCQNTHPENTISCAMILYNFVCVYNFLKQLSALGVLGMPWILLIYDSHFCLVTHSFKPLSKTNSVELLSI